jgi:hypothetical protein
MISLTVRKRHTIERKRPSPAPQIRRTVRRQLFPSARSATGNPEEIIWLRNHRLFFQLMPEPLVGGSTRSCCQKGFTGNTERYSSWYLRWRPAWHETLCRTQNGRSLSVSSFLSVPRTDAKPQFLRWYLGHGGRQHLPARLHRALQCEVRQGATSPR